MTPSKRVNDVTLQSQGQLPSNVFVLVLLSLCFLLWELPAVRADSISCGPPRVVAPDTAEINDPRPLIRWTPVAEAEHYRIQLRSRVPEGKALVTLDSVVQGSEFRPPQPLADYRAQIQVTVSAFCRDGYGPASDVATGGRFYIDVSSSCVLNPPIELRSEGYQWRLIWPAVRQADMYHVAVYDGHEGKLLTQQEVRQPVVALAVAAQEPAIVMIRPHCLSGWGEPLYRPFMETRPD